ncbi:ImmA/IrrE family metallo-endopeptidase [Desulfotruncus alcoholivorax]|uniref:ImmA/IrrE family metallo-endopeptidase n=1 Tax=Desulfotruncus alcoholivorax TaxID=265477 RepID=UPI000403A77B|nr:ImmA/IrrE family metallo-endopeptidase [Desulfotruncus alcoholivorax]
MSLYKKARELAKSGEKPLDIARSLGFKVFFVPFQRIKGLAISLGDNKLIIIDSGLSDAEQQFVCGHELGHFLLHPSTNFVFILHNTFSYSKQEYQANRFSCELILGEKAEEYKYIILEAAAAGKLDQLVQLVWGLSAKEDEIP